jgi:hypothetical protein
VVVALNRRLGLQGFAARDKLCYRHSEAKPKNPVFRFDPQNGKLRRYKEALETLYYGTVKSSMKNTLDKGSRYEKYLNMRCIIAKSYWFLMGPVLEGFSGALVLPLRGSPALWFGPTLLPINYSGQTVPASGRTSPEKPTKPPIKNQGAMVEVVKGILRRDLRAHN